jgi:hypothetical protein
MNAGNREKLISKSWLPELWTEWVATETDGEWIVFQSSSPPTREMLNWALELVEDIFVAWNCVELGPIYRLDLI